MVVLQGHRVSNRGICSRMDGVGRVAARAGCLHVI